MAKRINIDKLLEQAKKGMDDIDAEIDRYKEAAKANGLNDSTWSMPGITDFNAPHPYKGAKKLSYHSDEFYGEPHGIFSAEIKGPNWIDLWIAANEILKVCGDKHHIYIEDFRRRLEPGAYELITGS